MFAAYNIEMSWLKKDARSGLRCKYVTKDGTILKAGENLLRRNPSIDKDGWLQIFPIGVAMRMWLPRSHTPRSTKVEPRVHGSPAQYTQLRVADCQMMSVSIVDHDEGQDLRSKVEVGSERSANVEVG